MAALSAGARAIHKHLTGTSSKDRPFDSDGDLSGGCFAHIKKVAWKPPFCLSKSHAERDGRYLYQSLCALALCFDDVRVECFTVEFVDGAAAPTDAIAFVAPPS